MFSVGTQWNPLQAQLRQLLTKGGAFEAAKDLLLNMHAMLHVKEVSGLREPTLMDEVWDGLTEEVFCTMPTADDVTVAWNVWHITRIEDLTSSILLANQGQVLDDGWQMHLHTPVKDTGNAMTDDEILSFSKAVKLTALKEYRNAVGQRTREIIGGLSPQDVKRKFSKDQIDRIFQEGGVTSHPQSVWLLNFWGKKNVAGILMMPTTRHQMGHLNDCLKLKEKCVRLLK